MTMNKDESLTVAWTSPNEHRVATWLEPELARVGPRAIARIEVRLVRGGEVARLERASDPIFEHGAPALARAIVAACADNVTGVACETFVVVATGAAGARSSMRLRIDGDDRGDVEAPTITGALEQLLRHNEVLLHAALRGASATSDVLASMNQQLLARVGSLEEARQRHVDEREALESARHERELAARVVANREQTRAKAVARMLDLLPAILMRYVGGSAKSGATAQPGATTQPGAKSGREELLDALIQSLRSDGPARLAQLATLLTVDELAALRALLEDVPPDDQPEDDTAVNTAPNAPGSKA
jgi:hypothetical protein